MRALFALLLAASFFAGCTSSIFTSSNEPPAVFRLAVPEVSPGDGPPLALALSVARPRASSALDTNRVAVVKPGLGFDYYAGIRWAETAPQMLQQMLVRTLAADGRFATVVAAPSRVPADWVLEVELRRFESIYRGHETPAVVEVELQTVLVDLRTGRRLNSVAARGQAVAADAGRAAMIGAFDQATSDAIGTVVSSLRRVPAPSMP